MAAGVFIHRVDTNYNDAPGRYHFPGRYYSRVKSLEGQWAVYYEPVKVRNSRGFYAMGIVDKVEPDFVGGGDMFYAHIDPANFVDFPYPVPQRGADGRLVERALEGQSGGVSGNRQSAVRPLADADFRRIVEQGFRRPFEEVFGANQVAPPIGGGLYDQSVPFEYEVSRERKARTVNAVVRATGFRDAVLRAYDNRCAVTGSNISSLDGSVEAQAAHIRPVTKGGPDVISNGIALSHTAHWLFDNGLLSVTDDRSILVSRHLNDAESVRALLNASGRIIDPMDFRHRPHPVFFQWHRDNVFKR